MVVARGLGLVEHLLDFDPSVPGRNAPFDDISLRVSEDGCPNWREDRQLAGIEVCILWKG